ncbi:hypothetical protein AMTRI_Chr04g253430 [Amborella trichopoda]
MRNFSSFISDSGLLDLPAAGAKFTRSNNYVSNPIMTRVDRFLANVGLAELFSRAVVRALPKMSFDHIPLIWECESCKMLESYLKFEMAWIKDKVINDLIKESSLRNEAVGWSGFIASKKVQGVMKDFIEWKKHNNCNYKVKIREVLDRITEIDVKAWDTGVIDEEYRILRFKLNN